VNAHVFLAALVFGFMLAELRLSTHNERRLLAQGAWQPSGDVYRAMAVLYPAAFLFMSIEGIWRAALAPGHTGSGPAWAVSGMLLFAASKALKYWAIRALGDRWSFRVIVVPGAPLVTSGPYRYVAHPNYIAVVGELVATAMMMSAWISGPILTAAFGIVLALRVKFEARILAQVAAGGSRS
jgi:methyltransferase